MKEYLFSKVKTLKHLINLSSINSIIVSIIFSYSFTTSMDFNSEEILNFKSSQRVETNRLIFSKNLGFLNTDYEYRNFLEKKSKEYYVKSIIDALPMSIKQKAEFYLFPIYEISEFYGLDPLWVTSIVWTESHFKVRSRSRVGATGLMQLMPSTKKYIEKKLIGHFKFSNYVVHFPFSRSFYYEQLRQIEIGVYYLYRLTRRFKKRSYATVA